MSGTNARRRLSKRDVETLMAAYDVDPVAALHEALARLMDRENATFESLLQLLVDEGRLPPDRYVALAARDVDALDALARDLNEIRTLPS